MDALAPGDEPRKGGRRSRVVLIPRRWDQVGGNGDVGPDGRDTPRWLRWQESPVTEEITKETVKTTRAGNAGRNRRDRGDYTRMLFLFCMRGAGAIRAPGIPCALSAQTLAFVATLGERIYAKLGQVLPRDREGVSKVAV